MPSKLLIWTEQITGPGLHHMHTAKGEDGTIYRVRPVYYGKKWGRKFAGWRVSAGNRSIRGWKTMLHEAKASAQRVANSKRNVAAKAAKLRGKRIIDFDHVEPVTLSIPSPTRRVLDLD